MMFKHHLKAWLAGVTAAASITASMAVALPTAASAAPLVCNPQHYGWTFDAANNYAAPNPGDRFQKIADGCGSVWIIPGQSDQFVAHFTINGQEYTSTSAYCSPGSTCQVWNPAINYVPFYIVSVYGYENSNIYF